jgi:hypothetical protein
MSEFVRSDHYEEELLDRVLEAAFPGCSHDETIMQKNRESLSKALEELRELSQDINLRWLDSARSLIGNYFDWGAPEGPDHVLEALLVAVYSR